MAEQMNPADVPDEWLQAAFDAIGRSGTSDGDEQVRHVLAALLPLVCERIAAEIADHPGPNPSPANPTWWAGYTEAQTDAARIARGGGDA